MGGNIVCGFGGDLIEVHIFINEIVYNYERLLGILCKTFIGQFALFFCQFEKKCILIFFLKCSITAQNLKTVDSFFENVQLQQFASLPLNFTNN